MNKSELVVQIAEKAELSSKTASKALDALQSVISEELKNGGKVQIVGFGTFETSQRPAREGRNPKTGASMTIPASKCPKFKAGKALKDYVSM